MEQRNDPFGPSEPTAAGTGAERTPMEQMAESARVTASQAANSFRRGEFLNNAASDPDANADDRLIALLAYATQIVIPLIMPVIVLLSESSKVRPFQRYHAVQSLALTCLFIALGVGVGIGTAILQIIPLVGLLVGLLVLCMTPIAYLMYVIALLYYGYQAYQGKRFAIPGLTAFLRDQGWL
ncbi:MAG: hypothetical protein KF832_24790 [Caldilineaceae bacterium]|nr:hypothetical protein [Caldilineaceae bacterium]